MKNKYYLVTFTYILDGQEFRYRRPLTSEKTGRSLEKEVKEYIKDIEGTTEKWNGNTLEIDLGMKVQFDDIREITQLECEVLEKYI